MKLSYNNQIQILNDIYINMNLSFSKAYLIGSNWYIGESLINNIKFVYPPDYSLIFYGFKKKHIDKSITILNILSRYLISKKIDNITFFFTNYNFNNNFDENLRLYKNKNNKNLILN